MQKLRASVLQSRSMKGEPMTDKLTSACWRADVQASHKAVLLALAHLSGGSGTCSPRVRELAAVAGASRRAVFDALAALESRGLIKRDSGKKDGDRNTYTLTLSGEK